MPQSSADPVRLSAGGTSAEIAPRGAELMSWQVGGRELIWSGDPAHWAFRAPLLFPVVGASAGGRVVVDGRAYPMPQHGFARSAQFACVDAQSDQATFRLEADAATLAHYPFRFRLDVTVALRADSLSVSAEVANRDDRPMPYAFGFHPAFPWPLDGAGREGHRVEFEAVETTSLPGVSAEALLVPDGRHLEFDGRSLALEPGLFSEALVFLDARSRSMAFVAPSGRRLVMESEDCPHLAIWTRPTAPFLSLEAWTGHADWHGFEGELSERASIRRLAPGASARHAIRLSIHDP
jgi:galactose mutarotase-like enzyme